MRVRLDIPEGSPGLVSRHRYAVDREWTGAPHRHAELEFNLVRAGSATVLVDGRRLELGAQSLLWLFPGQDHLLARQSADFEMWVAVFRAEQVREVARVEGFAVAAKRRPAGRHSRMLGREAFTGLQAILARLADAHLDALSRRSGFTWLLLEAWRVFFEAEDLPTQADLHPAVERIAFLLRDRPETESLEQAARAAGLSLSWLSRLFHQQMGMTLAQFRNRQRIHAFMELYGAGRRRNLTEAALEAGFASYPQFFRVFREHTGHAPREYFQREGPGESQPQPHRPG